MKTINLPAGATHVLYGDLAHLIADALWPTSGEDDERLGYGLTRVALDNELKQAVQSGALHVKDPLTCGTHAFPIGQALLSSLVTVADLSDYVADRGITVPVETAEQSGQQSGKNGKRWNPALISEVRDYRASHTEKETAEKYGVSGSLIRRKLAPPKKAKAQPFDRLGSMKK